ncbi:MAG: hypothetical protein OQK51_16530 [Kangiellaceae bacterium]|nr:hypothetical protein [Kangiellaceae bacterium]
MINLKAFEYWDVSADKSTLLYQSGYKLVKAYNEESGPMEWIQFPEPNELLFRQGLRCLYHTEGLALIQAYIDKHSFSVDDLLGFIEKESAHYNFDQEIEGSTETYTDVTMIVLNEYKPRKLEKDEFKLILSGDAYCEPWISSMIRSGVNKWNRRKSKNTRETHKK